MKHFFILLAVIIATSVVFAGITLLGDTTTTEVLGMQVVSAGNFDQPAWLCVGGGAGVLVVGVGGVGVVSITLYGAGLLFATGQLAVGLLCIAQLGVGPVFFFGQVGAGFVAFGQLVFGALTGGQVPIGFNGKPMLRGLSAELNQVLAFR